MKIYMNNQTRTLFQREGGGNWSVQTIVFVFYY